jgi:endoglucanase
MRRALSLWLLLGCGPDGNVDAGRLPDGATPMLDAGPGLDAGRPFDAGPIDPPVGTLTGDIRVDHFGWRTFDRKIGLLLGMAGASVELRRYGDNSTVGTYTASALIHDDDSGDDLAEVDFSAVTEEGEYYLYLPSTDRRSYPFRIADDVYDVVGAVAMRSYYFQRCNHDRALPFASDRVGAYSGAGQWVDGVCHTMDSALTAGPGSPDHGPLDLRGGWHDAGDYQKTLWGRGVPQILFAYEVNPDAWPDGQLQIPESGNGIPDLLDEVRWELDFYVRMQRPDGHFMTSAKGRAPSSGAIASPPSASNEGRVYFDTVAPSGDGWSGGGVTLAAATGNATLALAHAAIVFRAAGQTAIADGYAMAARNGWTWLEGQSLSGEEGRLRASAAAAIHRMDPSITSAGTVVSSFAWETWDGGIPGGSATPGDGVLSVGAWHVLMDSTSGPGLVDEVRTGVIGAILDPAFEEDGAYGGMRGGPGNGWDYSWGSNRAQSQYGANVLMARHLGITGGHSDAELDERAVKHMHYMLGRNPLNMVYLTNMAAYGGEHSSFQAYHAWFSYTGNDGDNGNAMYNGRPSWVDEPLYPYYPDDDATSTYGPAPGIVVGGPNYYYSCGYEIPNMESPLYAYRDFSTGCDWDGSQCLACAWEITEPSNSYQGPFIMLASFLMD